MAIPTPSANELPVKPTRARRMDSRGES
jgi:hypothetical protein